MSGVSFKLAGHAGWSKGRVAEIEICNGPVGTCIGGECIYVDVTEPAGQPKPACSSMPCRSEEGRLSPSG